MSSTKDAALSTGDIERLKANRRRWELVRTSTAPVDRAVAEEGVLEVYRAAGFPRPRDIVWCNGPLELARTRAASAYGDRAGANTKAELISAPLREADRLIRERLSPAQSAELRRIAQPLASSAASRAVVSAVAADTGFTLTRRPVLRRFLDWALRWRSPPWPNQSFTDAGLSQHDAPSLYVYAFVRDVLSMRRETGGVNGILKVAENVGWFVPHRNACFVSERHDLLKIDAEGRLHSGSGPALTYPDRWCHYAWKGVGVAPWMIEQPEWIDLNRIEREPDPVLRHCMVDILTAERFIRNGWARRVAQDDTGTLWQRNWRHGGVWAAVEVVNGSPEPDHTYKHYYLTVPGNLRSAREAVAWTYGMSEWEYESLRIRT